MPRRDARRLTRQYLTETACLAIAGVLGGIGGAHVLLGFLVHRLADVLPARS